MACHFICYSSTTTGSRELRAWNRDVCYERLRRDSAENLTLAGEYALWYDSPRSSGGGGKSNEPNFDGYLACIAHMCDEDFDASFEYVPVTLESQGIAWGRGHLGIAADEEGFVDEQRRTLVFAVRPFGRPFGRFSFSTSYQAAAARHIFILAPLSEESFAAVVETVRSASKARPVFIHYQGEQRVVGCDEKVFWNMTPPSHTFPNSFNYFAGMKFGVQLRALLAHCAHSYAVRSKRGCADGPIPKIYVSMSEYIHNSIYTKRNPAGRMRRFAPLNTSLVVQDMYDKDNVTALAIFARHGRKSTMQSDDKIRLCVVGRECYRIADKTLPATVLHASAQEIRESIDFAAPSRACSSYWPPFAPSSKYTCIADPTRTLFENRIMAAFLLEMLGDLHVRGSYNVSESRGRSTVAIAGKCKFDVAPFNEAVFVPSLAYALDRVPLLIEKSLYSFPGTSTLMYFCRHGETEGNRAKKFQVASMPLSEKGVLQAKLLGKRISDASCTRNEPVAIISSTLLRTRQTTQHIVASLKNNGCSFVLQYCSELQERNFGTLRGTLYRDFPDFGKLLQNDFKPPGGGESKRAFEARVSRAMHKVRAFAKRAHKRGCRFVVIVSHGLVLNSILCKHCNVPNIYSRENLNGLKNSSVSCALSDHKHAPQIHLVNCVRHLKGTGAEALVSFEKKKRFINSSAKL